MNTILCRQLALYFCCTPEEVADHENHFTEHHFLEGRRRFLEGTECFLKIAVVNGKLLFSGNPRMLDWCRERYENMGSEWFFEAKNLRILNDRLHEEGWQIETAHPFFISEKLSDVDTSGYTLRWYEQEDIEQFREENPFDEAFAFCADAPDVLGVAAVKDGRILGMAGASYDSPLMWQIGIDVEKDVREAGIGKMLTGVIKNEILRRGVLPFYGTSMSHIASQRVALGSGFVPAWAELAVSKTEQ